MVTAMGIKLASLLWVQRKKTDRGRFGPIFTVPSAGIIRIRFDGLAFASQPGIPGTPTVEVNGKSALAQGQGGIAKFTCSGGAALCCASYLTWV